jgi:outer membrane protein
MRTPYTAIGFLWGRLVTRLSGRAQACPAPAARILIALLAPLAFAQTTPLTLQDAEALAVKNHPRVLAAQNAASAMDQRVPEAKAAFYPVLSGDVTGSQANPLSRIGAGALTDSRLFNRVGQGLTLTQLITDSGRTSNLVATSKLQAGASQQTYRATRYDILVNVNQAYFATLRAQATVKVAEKTVATRQTLLDQVTALYNNKLRSELDVSFVAVNVSQAKLLLLQAQDEVQEAFAELTRALGAQDSAIYQLAEEPLPPSPPGNPVDLVKQALAARPELASLQLNRDAAYRFENAEKDLSRPNVSLIGVGGVVPYINTTVPKEYEGIAVDLQIPLFNGGLFRARRQEAHFRALEADQRLRDEADSIARDVRTAWSAASVAYQRLDVTAQLLRQATLALDLAEGRYDLGLSSIVELSQAQLNLTQAEIENLSAKYNYQSQYAALQYTFGALR